LKRAVHTLDSTGIGKVLPLARDFYAESGSILSSENNFDDNVWSSAMLKCIESDTIRVLYTTKSGRVDGECVALMTVALVVSPFDGRIEIHEAMWYVAKGHRSLGHGMTLLRSLDTLAGETGAARIIMTHLENNTGDRLSHILPRFGYKPLEVTYSKEVI
tara:strand:- start:375 stop:854 length:480 start_codon:yes stop_codon:yes gene_type:complete